MQLISGHERRAVVQPAIVFHFHGATGNTQKCVALCKASVKMMAEIFFMLACYRSMVAETSSDRNRAIHKKVNAAVRHACGVQDCLDIMGMKFRNSHTTQPYRVPRLRG